MLSLHAGSGVQSGNEEQGEAAGFELVRYAYIARLAIDHFEMPSTYIVVALGV